MSELFKITEKNGKGLVSARELYDHLGYEGNKFARWSKSNIINNPFAVENEDWVGLDIVVQGNKTKDYAISIELAKKLSMISKTAKGEEARVYFLECETKLKQLPAIKPMSTADMFMLQAQFNKEYEVRISSVEEDVKLLKAHTVTRPDNYFAVSGYASLNKINIDHETAKKIGRKAASICKEMGYVMGSVPDAKYGAVKTYPSDVLEVVFKEMLGLAA